ncbi:MAG: methylamine utilization protein MauJ, partial [Ferrovibrio sp.]
GILSIVPDNPKFAGFSAIVLRDLKPIGGVTASFHHASTFGGALEIILENSNALTNVIEIRISISEMYTNGHGRASIHYREGDHHKTAFFIGKEAVSLMQVGSEESYDPAALISSTTKETVLYPEFFRRLIQTSKIKYTVPLDVVREDNEKEAQREERNRRLGIGGEANFLNLMVDCQVTWPNEETVTEFEGKKIVLMPKTRQTTTSLHIDLHSQKLSVEEAGTLINRFLSIMSWCDDQFSFAKSRGYGSPAPIAMGKTELAFATAYHWVFNRTLPVSKEAQLALAIFREALNAHANNLVSYAVLSYYKVIEIKYRNSYAQKKWFKENFQTVRSSKILEEEVSAFLKLCGAISPEIYIYKQCRNAVAHAHDPKSTDPDNVSEIRRLHLAADIMHAFARLFIENEFKISDCVFDGT